MVCKVRMDSSTERFSFLKSNQFVLNVVNVLYKSGRNLVFSPYSLTSALVMLLVGADGNSRTELIRALFGEKATQADADKYVKAFSEVNKATQAKNETNLNMANLIYPHKSFSLKDEFVSTLTDGLHAEGKTLDFAGNNQEALQTINSDVSQATHGLIDRLLNNIDSNTQLVLVNAIYFKGFWEKAFDKQCTTKAGDFYTTTGHIVKTALMHHRRKSTPFFQDPITGTKAVQLDYRKEGNIAMVLILPGEGATVETFIKSQLTDTSLKHILTSLRSVKVNLTVPRFKLNATHQLVTPLCTLGIRDIFNTSRSNLSRLSNNSTGLTVSDILQKAVIEVNEEGTEAAVATAVIMTRCVLPICEVYEFNANRPFLFALVTRDAPQLLLFTGVVEDPSKN